MIFMKARKGEVVSVTVEVNHSNADYSQVWTVMDYSAAYAIIINETNKYLSGIGGREQAFWEWTEFSDIVEEMRDFKLHEQHPFLSISGPDDTQWQIYDPETREENSPHEV